MYDHLYTKLFPLYYTCPVFFTIRIASLINGEKFVGPAIRTLGVILLYASSTPRKPLQ